MLCSRLSIHTMPTTLALLPPICLLAIGYYALAHSAAEDDDVQHVQLPAANRTARIRKREVPGVDFNWKVTSKPKFVTGKLQKVLPILTVYPSDAAYRAGRARQPDGPKRIVYYATLPEPGRHSSPAHDHRYTTAIFGPYRQYPVPFNQQRSYKPNQGNEDSVTRVQSHVIDVRTRGDQKNHYPPPHTIAVHDAPPYYPDVYHHVAVLNGGGISAGKDEYGVLYGYGGNWLVEHVPPIQSRPVVVANAMRPYHGPQIPKLVGIPAAFGGPSLYTTYTASGVRTEPPYPSRFDRFPANRYPTNSPLAEILGPAAPRPSAEVTKPPVQPNTALAGLPATKPPASGLELNADLGPSTVDQADPSLRPLSYKNKFSTHLDPQDGGSPFGQKYTDFGTFNTDFSINANENLSDKPQLGSDWLNKKPNLDISQFESEDVNNALASNAASAGQESSSSAPSAAAGSSASLSGGVDLFADLNDTIIMPYLASFPNTSSIESQDRYTLP